MNDPLALGPVTRGLDPYFVHEAVGFGANKVNRLLDHVPAIFPYQLPVLFSVYVAFRFIKIPDVIGIGFVTFRVVTLVVERFESPVTLRAPPKRVTAFIMAALPLVETFRVEMFASVRTVKLVALAVAAFMVVTLVVERLEFPVTFKFVPKIEDVTLSVPVTLVVDRLEFPVTFKFVPKIEDVTLSVPVTLVVERFEFPVTFKFPPKIEDAFRVVTLVVERLEFPATFTVVQKTKGIVSVL